MKAERDTGTYLGLLDALKAVTKVETFLTGGDAVTVEFADAISDARAHARDLRTNLEQAFEVVVDPRRGTLIAPLLGHAPKSSAQIPLPTPEEAEAAIARIARRALTVDSPVRASTFTYQRVETLPEPGYAIDRAILRRRPSQPDELAFYVLVQDEEWPTNPVAVRYEDLTDPTDKQFWLGAKPLGEAEAIDIVDETQLEAPIATDDAPPIDQDEDQDDAEAEVVLVECPFCNDQQPDMGHGVNCDSCGKGPMPTTRPAPETPEAPPAPEPAQDPEPAQA